MGGVIKEKAVFRGEYPPVATFDLTRLAPEGILDEAVLTGLSRQVGAALADPSIGTICFRGSRERFLLGADRQFFARWVVAGDLQPILKFTRAANELLCRIQQSPKRTMAYVEAMATGAGWELALACREVVVSPQARFRLPETGLGIFPGMGGTQRLPRRVAKGLAKAIIYTGSIVPASVAVDLRLADRMVPAGATVTQICQPSATVSPAGSSGDEKWRLLEQFFNTYSVDELLAPDFPEPEPLPLKRAWFDLKQKSPAALRGAEHAVDRGYGLPLAEGLAVETAGLSHVFNQPDTLRRLTST